MKNMTFLLIVLLSLVFTFTTDTFAFEKKVTDSTSEMDKRLDLTKEQIEQLYKLRNRYCTDIQRLRHEIFQKKIELKNLYFDSKTNESAILEKQKELLALRQKLEEKRSEMMLEERKILTSEQLDMLGRFPLEKRYERTGPGKGKFRRGFGPPNF